MRISTACSLKSLVTTNNFFVGLASFLTLYSQAIFSADLTVDPNYKLQQIVPPSPFCGVHGLGIDANDNLYAGSVVGQRLYTVDSRSGNVEVLVGPPKGMADDMEFLPDGTVVWTSISQNAVRAQSPGGEVRDLATNLASVNSIAYREGDGKLFVAQVFGGDGLWEIDVNGENPPRNILKDMGGLNGFDIGPDGMIYGPLWFKQQVVKIDPDTGELSVVADGFHTPAAANFDSQWNLYVLDTGTGEIISVDINGGEKSQFIQLKTSLDNLAIDSNDVLYVSNMADNSIQAIDIKTKAIRSVVEPGLSCPASITVMNDEKTNTDFVYIADVFALRKINTNTGDIIDIGRSHAANAPIHYATGVFPGEKNYYVLSSGVLQQYDRSTDTKTQEFDHIRGAQYVKELGNGDLLILSRSGKHLTRYSGEDKKTKNVISETLEGVSAIAELDKDTILATIPSSDTIAKINLSSGKAEEINVATQTPIDISISNNQQWLVRESQGRIISINPNNLTTDVVLENFPSGRFNNGKGNEGNSFALSNSEKTDLRTMYLLSDTDNSIYKISPNE